jgi:hypothetical protein
MSAETVSSHKALADALRFGPLAHYMRGFGWDESQRTAVADTVARDLISSGWIAESRQKPRCTDCTSCECQR